MTDIRIALTPAERRRAKQLIRRTSVDGADATLAYLRRFSPDAYPALVAYLASVACNAVGLEQRHAGMRYRPNQPELHTEDERRVLHRLYGRGVRTPDVVIGEREYQRVRAQKRTQRKKEAAA